METQTESVSLLLTAGDISCSVESCRDAVSAEVDSRLFCLNHFLSVSFQELQARHKRLLQKPDAVAATAFKEFLSTWARQAEELADDAHLEDQQMKALREVLGWISSTGKSLRRSPRTATAVPVWLRREDPRRTWEEDTWTSTVSRHGAGFVCRHPVEKGGMVIVTRKDKGGGRATARVVYSRIDSEGQRQIGVELVDRDDFWD